MKSENLEIVFSVGRFPLRIFPYAFPLVSLRVGYDFPLTALKLKQAHADGCAGWDGKARIRPLAPSALAPPWMEQPSVRGGGAAGKSSPGGADAIVPAPQRP